MKHSQLLLSWAMSMPILMAGCSGMSFPDSEPSGGPRPTNGTAQGGGPSPAAEGTSTRSEQPQPEAAPTPNAIPQVAQRSGLARCIPRIRQITSFVTANSQHGGYIFVAPATPDKRIASVVLEVQSGAQTAYVNTGFAPGQGQSECSGFYESITYWNNNCEAVATQTFKSFKRAKALRQSIMMLENGPNVRVFLMPAATGCVAIKKEMVYN